MVMQIHRTSGSGPPTGLEDGQLAVELDTTPPALWVGATGAPNTRLRLNDMSGYLPLTGGTLSRNVAALAAPQPGTMLQIANADGVTTRLLFDAFSSNNAISMRTAWGTAAAPAAMNLGNPLATIAASGYGATGYGDNCATITARATENWTDTAQGAEWVFTTTPNGTTDNTIVLKLGHDGQILMGPHAAGTVETPSLDTVLLLENLATRSTVITLDSFGGHCELQMRAANGTPGSPSATLGGDELGSITAQGYGATGFGGADRAAISAYATENWTAAAQGTKWQFIVTPNGQANPLVALSIEDNGNLLPGLVDNLLSCGVSGTAWASVWSYNFDNPSDVSLKQDLRDPPAGALAQVCALAPVEFHWRGRETAAMPYHRGFTAQEVRRVMGADFAGWREENGIQGLAYHELTAVLWQAVRELSAEVDTLKKEGKR